MKYSVSSQLHLLKVISSFIVPEKRCLIETVQMFKCFSSAEAYSTLCDTCYKSEEIETYGGEAKELT